MMWTRTSSSDSPPNATSAMRPARISTFTATPVPYLRLAFGHVPDDAIRDGMPVLAQCLREARTSNEPKSFTSLFD